MLNQSCVVFAKPLLVMSIYLQVCFRHIYLKSQLIVIAINTVQKYAKCNITIMSLGVMKGALNTIYYYYNNISNNQQNKMPFNCSFHFIGALHFLHFKYRRNEKVNKNQLSSTSSREPPPTLCRYFTEFDAYVTQRHVTKCQNNKPPS